MSHMLAAARGVSCFCSLSGDHRELHSFPTRRSSDLPRLGPQVAEWLGGVGAAELADRLIGGITYNELDRKSTRLNSSHVETSYAVFCLKKKTRAWPCSSQVRVDIQKYLARVPSQGTH